MPAPPPAPAGVPLEDGRYEQALGYLTSRINYEKVGPAPYNAQHYRLDRMRRLLGRLGNPHLRYPVIHVAGTKGKGTTSTLLADCLGACGFRTGLYTSPHLLRLEERIQIGGQNCSPDELVQLTGSVREAAEGLEADGGGRATFFELTTAMGMQHFANQNVHCAVLETGLGGRLDSTNVCQPVLSVITSISLDHQKQLGNTLAQIATEKAGIIKPGRPVVCTARGPESCGAILKQAAIVDAPVRLIDRDFSASWSPLPRQSQSLGEAVATAAFHPGDLKRSFLGESTWQTRMLGRHQADNIAGALATLDLLAELGWKLSRQQLQRAISQSYARARLELISIAPLRILDTAHNPASIQAGLEAIQEHFPNQTCQVVFASSSDKDYRSMLRQLVPSCRRLIVTAYERNQRAVPPDDLRQAAEQIASDLPPVADCAPDVVVAPTPAEAWELATRATEPDDILYITGSFFLAAELLELVEP